MGSKSSKEVTACTIVKEYLIEQLGKPKSIMKWEIYCRGATVEIRLDDNSLSVRAAGEQMFDIKDNYVKWDFGGDKLLLADPNFFYKLSYDIARAMACASAGMYTHSCIGWMAKNEIEPHLSEYVKKWKNQ